MPERMRAAARAIVAGATPVLHPDRQVLMRLSALVTRQLGIRMPLTKLSMLESRLLRRLRALRLSSLHAYERLLTSKTGQAEIPHFYDVVTTNKTEFFREPAHFDYLVREAVPTLMSGLASQGRFHLRVWCAGCSSGHEVYTLAMVLAEVVREQPAFSFAITASDISSRVLREAHAATYPEDLIEPVPMALRKRYLLRSKLPGRKVVRIAPELRRHVSFVRLNFMDEEYPLRGRFDVIFFRNVMIYFDKPTQEAVLRRQCRFLQPGGYLFTSHTESISGLDVPLRAVAKAVYRRSA